MASMANNETMMVEQKRFPGLTCRKNLAANQLFASEFFFRNRTVHDSTCYTSAEAAPPSLLD